MSGPGSWDRHLHTGPFDSSGRPSAVLDLPERIRSFLVWQTARWPRLAEARAALGLVRTREEPVGDGIVELQWNPGRAVSSTAKVDPATVARRPCFLCPDSLPPEEAGLAWGDDWVVLPNPAPILEPHLVIAHRDHTPQDALRAVGPLVDFAAESGLTVLYNGPRCGASAPDHLHLQAVGPGVMPEERAALRALATGVVPGVDLGGDGVRAWSARGTGRAMLAVVGPPDRVRRALETAIELLPGEDGHEPRLNLLATAAPGGVLALLFPRGAHRPACFFAEGPAQRVVSPGVVDMAGTVVIVRAEDFEVLDGPTIEAIYGEVTLPPERCRAWEETLRRRWSDG